MSTQSAAFGDSAVTHSSVAPTLHQPPRLSGWDYAGMLAGFVLTLTITIVNSHGRVFWEDEMLGWLLLTDPSWHHMIRAWNLGADGGGFSFYVLGRAWFAVFGHSHLAFRLFSSTCFGIAFIALWNALRRRYSTGIVALAAFNTFFFSPPFAQHLLEGRFYGLLVMSTALGIWLALKLEDTPDPTPARFYFAAFFIHALLTTSHLLGVVFSAFVLAATILVDRIHGRRRLGLYCTVAAAWLLLLLERTSIAAAARVGKPHFWTKPPKLSEIVAAYSGFSHEILLLLFLLFIATLLVLRKQPGGIGRAFRNSFHQRPAVYIITLCLLLVPAAFLLEGLVGTWLFTERYLQPVTLAMAFITAELCLLLSQHAGTPLSARMPPALISTVQGTFAVLFAAFLLFWDFNHVALRTPSPPDFTSDLTAHLPHNLPVVVEDAFTFTELMDRQAHSDTRYMYLLDWPFAVSPAAPRLEAMQFHLMENLKLAGYFPDHIAYVDTFLRDNPRFLLVHDTGIHPAKDEQIEIGNPLEDRLAQNPQYQLRKIFTLDRIYHDGVRDTVWLACRGGCGANPIPAQGPTLCIRYAPDKLCCDDQPCIHELPKGVLKAID